MDNKVVMVTGATNGIGEVTALELARKGAHVVVVSRSAEKLERTVQRITDETGNPHVAALQADLSLMAQVRQAAEQFHERYDRLDVLVNNAGAYFNNRQMTAEGYEMTFALNHLNYFLLTNLLLETIQRTAQQTGDARIINVSSGAHEGGRIDFDNLQKDKGFSGFGAYAESKLMNVMFTYALARRLHGTNVTVNAVHPGFVNTGFGMNNGGILRAVVSAIQLFGRSPEKGAETSIYLASSPQVQGITGKYWVDSQQKRSSARSHNETTQERLWAISEEITGITEASVRSLSVD